VNRSRTAQLTLVLGGFLGKDVALERLTPFDRPAAADLEALGGAPLGFHFRHVDSSVICAYRWLLYTAHQLYGLQRLPTRKARHTNPGRLKSGQPRAFFANGELFVQTCLALLPNLINGITAEPDTGANSLTGFTKSL